MKAKFHFDINQYSRFLYETNKMSINVIDSFKKKLWTFKYECNAKAWNCEKVNKLGIRFFV